MKIITIIPDRLAHYRVPVFDCISRSNKAKVIIAADLRCDKSGIKKPSKEELQSCSFDFKNSIDWRINNRLMLSTASLKAFKGNSDVVVIWGDAGAIGNWFAALSIKYFSNKKLVFWTHGLYGKESWFLIKLRSLFYKLADALLLYGEHSKYLLVEQAFDSKKLFVINNSLDTKMQEHLYQNQHSLGGFIDKDRVDLIFVGRLTKVKKLGLLISAVAKIAEERDVMLTIIGDGTESSSLQRLCSELKISDLVDFQGAIYDEERLATEIIKADMMVSPGNIGLTAMHSLVYGTPVVTHSNMSNQMPESESVREGLSGCLFEEGNVNSLASAILRCKEQLVNAAINQESCRNVINQFYSTEYQTKIFSEMLDYLEKDSV